LKKRETKKTHEVDGDHHLAFYSGLRYYTINPGCLDRVVPEEGIIAEGVPIPGGTYVGIQAWTTHHDPAVWDDPWSEAVLRHYRHETYV